MQAHAKLDTTDKLFVQLNNPPFQFGIFTRRLDQLVLLGIPIAGTANVGRRDAAVTDVQAGTGMFCCNSP